MSKKQNQKLITPEIMHQAIVGSFMKLNPRYMMKNPVMFVVEIGCIISLILSIVPGLFGDVSQDINLRLYNILVCIVLFITILFANFAESVAEGRGKAQAASLKKTQKDTKARVLLDDGSETEVLSSQLKKGDIVLVKVGEVIPGDGEVIEGIASVDESAITGESAPVVRESGGDFCSVTGGTTVVSDWLKIQITSDPGNSFLDRMISLVEGASRKKTPNDIEYVVGFLDHHFSDCYCNAVSHWSLQWGTASDIYFDCIVRMSDSDNNWRFAFRNWDCRDGPCYQI